MKKLLLSLAALSLVAVGCKKEEAKDDVAMPADTTAVVATETTEAAKPMDSAAMMKAWQDYATPGEAHKMLAMDNGNWNAEATMYRSDNDPKPTKSTMTAVNRMVMGGRYQEARFSGNMMGQPFEGISTTAYNNASKQVESSWIDNMGTGVMFLKGDYDGKAKTMELKGEVTDPMTGKVKPVRETFTVVNDNTRKMEMFDVDTNGKEFKSMEIVMTRKK